MRGLATALRDFRRKWLACLVSSVNRCKATCLLIERTRITRSTLTGITDPLCHTTVRRTIRWHERFPDDRRHIVLVESSRRRANCRCGNRCGDLGRPDDNGTEVFSRHCMLRLSLTHPVPWAMGSLAPISAVSSCSGITALPWPTRRRTDPEVAAKSRTGPLTTTPESTAAELIVARRSRREAGDNRQDRHVAPPKPVHFSIETAAARRPWPSFSNT
jgi:hypothetical protein